MVVCNPVDLERGLGYEYRVFVIGRQILLLPRRKNLFDSVRKWVIQTF
jgi:hypothetical protein